MKFLPLFLLVLVTSTAHAAKHREMFFCVPYGNSEEDQFVIAAGVSDDFYSFVQIGEETFRSTPVDAKKADGRKARRWDWWDENNNTQSMIVSRDDRFRKGAYVADFYDFSETNEDGKAEVLNTWQCAKR